MWNHEHDIVPPAHEKMMRVFLLSDYFHDSVFEMTDLDQRNRTLRLRLWCEREFNAPDECWDWFGVQPVGIPELPRNQREAAKKPGHPAHRRHYYLLTFKACAACDICFEPRGRTTYPEYLNGRFKDSVRLRQIVRQTRRQHYHFRIETSEGLIDLIFRKFAITREVGSMRVRVERRRRHPLTDSQRAWAAKSNAAIVRELPELGEWDCRTALQYLFARRYKGVLSLARRELKARLDPRIFDPWDHVLPMAIDIVGRLGGEDCLPLLMDAARRFDYALARQHVADAVDRIWARRAGAKEDWWRQQAAPTSVSMVHGRG